MRENSGIFHKLFLSLANEFQRNKFSLSHEPKADFFKSQWQTQKKSLKWLFYRWVFALSFTIGVIGSWINQFHDGKWFIYLTNWGFLLCMYTSIFGAVLVTISYYGRDEDVHSWVLKVYWASHWITLVMATLITLLYWTCIYPTANPNESGPIVYNIWSHALNSILMLLDHLLVAFPVRILHFIYPLLVGVIYALFTLFYYFAGRVDWFGNSYIYHILDWSTPGWAILTTLSCVLLIFALSFIHFGIYKLRTFICYKNELFAFTLNV